MRSSSALVTPCPTAARLRGTAVAVATIEVTAAVRRNVRREVFIGRGRMEARAQVATRECGPGGAGAHRLVGGPASHEAGYPVTAP